MNKFLVLLLGLQLTLMATDPVDKAFSEFEKEVYLLGLEPEPALEKLVSTLIDSKVSTTDLTLYVTKHASGEELKTFKNILNNGFSQAQSLNQFSKSDLEFLMERTLMTSNVTGSNFMSCTTGPSLGIPLIVSGVILGVIAVVNASASDAVVKSKWIESRRNRTDEHLNVVADLNLEIATYEADIIYYEDEIAELNRRINSGMYSASEIESMRQAIRDNEFFITDAQALIEEVKVDLVFFENQYAEDQSASDLFEQEELNKQANRRANASKFAIAGGLTAALGSYFTISGLADCN